MPNQPPQGTPAPASGELGSSAIARYLRGGDFGVYLHVPFCRRRCGYCDFNTYTPRELGAQGLDAASGPGGEFLAAAHDEIAMASRVLPPRRVDTVFFGGGTPTVLPPEAIGGLLDDVRDRFGLADDVEVTTEANPDTVDAGVLTALAEAGVTRVSLGMQSAVPHVLRTLDRTHDPAGVERAVRGAAAVGLAVSVDLIYGTPGESTDDWARSLDAAIALEPDHISAYALVVEEGTRLAAQVRRGVVPAPSDDDEATKYEMADAALNAAGFRWYEVSNWARTPAGVCRHNLGYWASGHWWGIGPSAHSHIGGVRWWNVRHPAAYAARLREGASPAQGREVLTEEERYLEHVLLTVRLADGLPLADLRQPGRDVVDDLVENDLCVIAPGPNLTLTRRGRLLADNVVRSLLP